ncbi:cation channel sperm-associated protein 2-like [Styela clava]|uniref:cation channel sperm-associated protein 2-like n=1 Tax=Styela clava TaxID=7725 RepID=UPI00193A65F0|nr:cation channel sperm-associated protein 2-like [Styela clava]
MEKHGGKSNCTPQPCSGIMDAKRATLLTPDEPKTLQGEESSIWGKGKRSSKQENASTEVLTPQAERFRMRLIRDFRLLENLNEMEQGLEAPKYHPADIQDARKRNKILTENPYALVKFSPIQKSQGSVSKQDRRWKRIKCRETKYPPLDLWANWVVESNWFQNFMLILIIFNAILLVLDAEITDTTVPANHPWIRIIRTCDYCCLWIFIVEILLKWVDDFKSFWTNGWNELDFYITVVSILPEVIRWINADAGSGGVMAALGFLRVLRITRLLKMVSRFEQARIILMAVTKAFSAMSFILLLLGLFMWMFAIMGEVLFDRYTDFDGRAVGIQLKYQTAFSDTLWAFATLFQLMTLDHWLETLVDLLIVMKDPYESTMTVMYILAWIWVGSFVFKNIFAGIMVNNFQTIRNDLHWEQKEREAKNEVDKFKKEFTEGLANQENQSETNVAVGSTQDNPDSLKSNVSSQAKSAESIREEGVQLLAVPGQNKTPSVRSLDSSVGDDDKLASALIKKRSVLSVMSQMSVNTITTMEEIFSAMALAPESEEAIYNAQWDSLVQCHLDKIHQLSSETAWPRDTLFRFYHTMEKLQENLQERQDIFKMTALAFLQIHDR